MLLPGPLAWVVQPYFELHLVRASLMDGTFRQLGAADPNALKKPLAVNILFFKAFTNTSVLIFT